MSKVGACGQVYYGTSTPIQDKFVLLYKYLPPLRLDIVTVVDILSRIVLVGTFQNALWMHRMGLGSVWIGNLT